MELQDIKNAVDNGRIVNWSNSNYEVQKLSGEYLIVCLSNNNMIGLTHKDGITLNGEKKDFFFNEKIQVENLLKGILPAQSYIEVTQRQNIFGGYYLKIMFSSKDYLINGVEGQRPDVVSLNLDFNTNELTTQIFGGNGGNCIYRKPNMDNPKEKHLAMVGIKIPFRQPKRELKACLKAIERFAIKWVETIKENKEILSDRVYVDYDEFLNS